MISAASLSSGIIAFSRQFVLAQAASNRQAQILTSLLTGLTAQLNSPEYKTPFAVFELASLVTIAIAGPTPAAEQLGAVAAFVFVGADVLDDLADGDLHPHWTGYSLSEIALAAAACLSCLPQSLIASLNAPPAVRDQMQRTLAEGLLHMAAGQHADLSMAGSNEVSPSAVQQAVENKSGEECALFCKLAAEFCHASPERVKAFSDMGRALAMAGQFAGDCYELFEDARGRDFAAGNRTLPIALHLQRLMGVDRIEFLALLESARTSEPARQQIREILWQAGHVRHCAFIAEVHRQQALRYLSAANPRETAASDLRRIIDNVSFFRDNLQTNGPSLGRSTGS